MIYVSSITLNKTRIVVQKGRTFTLKATVSPENATNKQLKWTTTDPSIAKVSNGVVTGIKAGSAYICAEATDGSYESTPCHVEVTNDVLVTKIELDASSLDMSVGDGYMLVETVSPQNATNCRLSWSSSDYRVATVDPEDGFVMARGVGTAVIKAMAIDGSGVFAECAVTVDTPVPVKGVEICPEKISISVGDTHELVPQFKPSNASDRGIIWKSSNTDVATIGSYSGEIRAHEPGTTTITATTHDGGFKATCKVWCDKFLYELVNLFGFTENDAKLIRKLYDKVEEKFDSYTNIKRAWVSSRLIGGICYGGESSGMNSKFKWNDVAGRVFSGSQEDYFVDILGFTSEEYLQMENAIKVQHNDINTPDFAHMQISLAARLAYKLNLDGFISNIGTFCSDETISYLAGWLGDATIKNNGQPSFGNDDYCADLDAENIYRTIISSTHPTIVEATNIYYASLNSNNNRAEVFLNYISIDVVKAKVFAELSVEDEDDPMGIIENSYPDTYNFLCSLSDSLENISNY